MLGNQSAGGRQLFDKAGEIKLQVQENQYQEFKEYQIQNVSSFSEGECTIQKAYGLKFSYFRLLLFILLTLCTGIVLFLLLIYWSVRLRRYFLFSFCKVEDATHFMILNWNQNFSIEPRKNYPIINSIGLPSFFLQFLNILSSEAFLG